MRLPAGGQGFLRIRDGISPLDAGAVHPESYPIVEAMAGDLNCPVGDLIKEEEIRKGIIKENYLNEDDDTVVPIKKRGGKKRSQSLKKNPKPAFNNPFAHALEPR